jgi:hypothetical protein
MLIEEILIISLMNVIVSNLITQVFRVISENKSKFKFTFVKQKKLEVVGNNLSISHPNTRFTWTGNGFGDHY